MPNKTPTNGTKLTKAAMSRTMPRAVRTKIGILSCLAAVLAALFVASLFLGSDARTARSNTFAWLDEKAADSAAKIEIKSASGETVTLVKEGGRWFQTRGAEKFPGNTAHIDDILANLKKKAPYPVRAKKESSFARLGVDDSASRITVKDSGERVLTDLFVGNADASGNDVYLRADKAKEVRSGADIFSAAIDSPEKYWQDLRLFNGKDTAAVTLETIQRIHYTAPPPKAQETPDADGEKPAERLPPLTIARKDGGWVSEPGDTKLEKSATESMIRALVDAAGESFGAPPPPMTSADNGSIVLELGDGSQATVSLGPRGETTAAGVSGSPYVYNLSDATLERIFKSVDTLKAK